MRKFLVTVILAVSCLNLFAKVVQRVAPDRVTGVKEHNLSLNGEWQLQLYESSKPEAILVPGEIAMQGYAIEHDKPVVYYKEVLVPSSFKGLSTILRFDGVYSYSRLWVNDKYIGEHFGGFTRWEVDVTKYVKCGAKNRVKLEVTDRLDDISYASGYAHHPVGGILRDVSLYAIPKEHISNLAIETLLDAKFKDAILKMSYDAQPIGEGGELSLELRDPKGAVVNLQKSCFDLKSEPIELPISNVVKWDAEHPNLYTLKVKVLKDGKESYSFTKDVGFRKIEIVEDQLLVNGSPVKLRGACRHDIHPTLGRTVTPYLDSLDVDIFKRSNMNFVRTSHYPPTERFMEYCDRAGLYVECETACCFVNTHRQKNYAPAASNNDTTFTHRYLGQLQEMVATFRSNPSVLFWSIGNESQYGLNFQLSYDWIKSADTLRPAISSYPGTVDKDKKTYDILSMHYPGVAGNLGQYGISTNNFQHPNIPSIFDEWAHVPCYTYATLQDDPNIRSFWGISLDKMWSTLFEAKGGLGGAIWGYIDETFMVPQKMNGEKWWIEFAKTAKPQDFQGDCIGYGEWGIVDVWRREKPEFWETKKAYSPLRILETSVLDYKQGMDIYLPIYNRFDHTTLDEVNMRYTCSGVVRTAALPAIAPHEKGLLVIEGEDWSVGSSLFVEFLTDNGELIDGYVIPLGERETPTVELSKDGEIALVESDTHYIVKGDSFEIPFSKESGLIENGSVNGEVLIEKGPFVNLDLNVSHKTGPEVREKGPNYIVDDKDWQKSSFEISEVKDGYSVELKGEYIGIAVDMEIVIFSEGRMEFSYHTVGEPNGWLRESGLKFYLSPLSDKLSWERKGYWSYYPEDNFSGNWGSTPLYNSRKVEYGEDSNQQWNDDDRNYYYFANRGAICDKPLINRAKGMKENSYIYSVSTANRNSIICYSPSASIACRMNKDVEDNLILYVNNRWDYPEIAWGDYCKALDVFPNYGKTTIYLR